MTENGRDIPADCLEPIRENKSHVEEVAERSDAVGATARVLLAFARGSAPSDRDVAASHFDLEVGDDGKFHDIRTSSPLYQGPPPEPDEVTHEVDCILKITTEE